MMRKTQVLFAVIAGTLAAAAIPVFAQTQMAGSQQWGSTEISGRILGIGDDEFLLETSAGQVLVDVEDRSLRRANLQEGEEITVTGYRDEEDFDAYTIVRSNGEVIQVWD